MWESWIIDLLIRLLWRWYFASAAQFHQSLRILLGSMHDECKNQARLEYWLFPVADRLFFIPIHLFPFHADIVDVCCIRWDFISRLEWTVRMSCILWQQMRQAGALHNATYLCRLTLFAVAVLVVACKIISEPDLQQRERHSISILINIRFSGHRLGWCACACTCMSYNLVSHVLSSPLAYICQMNESAS